MREINLNKAAAKYLDKLPPKHARQISYNLLQLRENIALQDAKPLKEFPYLRIDSGEYRIVYSYNETTVKIALIGKRNDDEVYKKLKPM